MNQHFSLTLLPTTSIINCNWCDKMPLYKVCGKCSRKSRTIDLLNFCLPEKQQLNTSFLSLLPPTMSVIDCKQRDKTSRQKHIKNTPESPELSLALTSVFTFLFYLPHQKWQQAIYRMNIRLKWWKGQWWWSNEIRQ